MRTKIKQKLIYGILSVILGNLVSVAPVWAWSTDVMSILDKVGEQTSSMASTGDPAMDKINERIIREAQKLSKLVAKETNVSDVKFSFSDPTKSRKETEETAYLPEGSPLSVKNINNIREQRYETRREAIYQNLTKAASDRFEGDGITQSLNSKVELMPTTPGESEGSGINAEVMLEEAEVLRRYIEQEITNLYMEAAIAMAGMSNLTSTGEISENFELCAYYTERRKKKSFMEQAKSAVNKAKDLGQKVKSAVDAGKEKLEQAKEMYEAGKDMANEAAGLAKDLKGVGGDLSDIGGIGGMI